MTKMRPALLSIVALAGVLPARAENPAQSGKVTVYVGTYTGPKSEGIYRFELDLFRRIHLYDLQRSSPLEGDLFENWRKLPARWAPGRVEVDEDRPRRSADLIIERPLRDSQHLSHLASFRPLQATAAPTPMTLSAFHAGRRA